MNVIPAPSNVIPAPSNVIPASSNVIPASSNVIPAKAGIHTKQNISMDPGYFTVLLRRTNVKFRDDVGSVTQHSGMTWETEVLHHSGKDWNPI